MTPAGEQLRREALSSSGLTQAEIDAYHAAKDERELAAAALFSAACAARELAEAKAPGYSNMMPAARARAMLGDKMRAEWFISFSDDVRYGKRKKSSR